MEIIFQKQLSLQQDCWNLYNLYKFVRSFFEYTFLSMQNKIVFSTNILLLMFANKTEPIVIKTNNLY